MNALPIRNVAEFDDIQIGTEVADFEVACAVRCSAEGMMNGWDSTFPEFSPTAD
jgi:hypothetical protein